MGRNFVLAGSLAVILLLGGLMIAAAIEGPVNVFLLLISLLVLALLGFGVLGALLSRPPDE
jgi:hypothetical protein